MEVGTSTPNRTGVAPQSFSGDLATPDPRRWLILVVIAVAQLMIVLDATIMNIALPSAQRALHFSLADRQWVVTAYALAFGSLLLLCGKLADVLGRKRTFIAGLVGFATASAVGGASVNFTMLVTARVCQGAFAALLAPSALSLLATTFTAPADRRRAFGVYGAVAGAGGGVGLILGGLLTEYLSWRWCLYVNLFFAGFAVIGAMLYVGKQTSWDRARLDVPGAILISGGMFCLVYGFSNVALHQWGDPLTWGFLVAGFVLVAGFAWWQTRASSPLLPLSILRNRNRSGAYVAMFLSGAGMFGVLLFLNYYMQEDLGYSPVKTGLAFLPMVVLTMTITNISNVVLMPRTGPRPLVALGMLLGAVSAGLLTRLGAHSTYATHILPSVVLIGAGLGLIFAPVADTGTSDVATKDTGVASATVNTGNQLGGSIGTSLLNSLFASAASGYIAANFERGSVDGRPTPRLTQMALLHGYTTAFWWVVGIFGVGAIMSGALLRSGPLTRYAPAGPQEGFAQLPGGVSEPVVS